MLSFSGSLKIFVLVEPCDMRKGFNGLYGMVSTTFDEDPRSGALFGSRSSIGTGAAYGS
jgi:transposase